MLAFWTTTPRTTKRFVINGGGFLLVTILYLAELVMERHKFLGSSFDVVMNGSLALCPLLLAFSYGAEALHWSSKHVRSLRIAAYAILILRLIVNLPWWS